MPVRSLKHARDAGSDGSARTLGRERVRVERRGRVRDLSSAGRRPSPDCGGDVHGGLGQLRADDEELLVQVTRGDQGQGVDERVAGADDQVGPQIHGLDDPVHSAVGLRHGDGLEPDLFRRRPTASLPSPASLSPGRLRRSAAPRGSRAADGPRPTSPASAGSSPREVAAPRGRRTRDRECRSGGAWHAARELFPDEAHPLRRRQESPLRSPQQRAAAANGIVVRGGSRASRVSTSSIR